jgi:hypothetical protein
MSMLARAADEEQALEQLHRAGMTDGLPVVIPTRRRVDAMVLASGHDGEVSLGEVGPSGAAATIEAVAVNAVMAGCLPDHFPVLVAAVKAVCDPRYDLTEIQVTTNPITPLVIVNGPVRHSAGIHCDYGVFGPGFRANASIGRALRLVMMNIGGGKPGISDMSVFGSPAKFTFCAGENEEQSPWEPLHVARGFAHEQSTVTVLAVEGGHSCVCAPMPDDCVGKEIEYALNTMSSVLGSMGSASTYNGKGDVGIIVNPQIAVMFADAGIGRMQLQQELAHRTRYPRKMLRECNPFMMPAGREDELIPDRDPASIVIAVAGGRGGYVMVCPTLGVSPHHHPSITVEVETNQYCALPSAS